MATVPAKHAELIEVGNSGETLPDHLVYRNASAAGTRHELGGVVPATIHKAVDVLEETGGAVVPATLRHWASIGRHHPTVR
jgi:hypothetical protein